MGFFVTVATNCIAKKVFLIFTIHKKCFARLETNVYAQHYVVASYSPVQFKCGINLLILISLKVNVYFLKCQTFPRGRMVRVHGSCFKHTVTGCRGIHPCDWPSGVSIPRPHRASTECSLCPSHSLPHTPPTSGRSRAFARCWQRSRHPCSRSGPLPNVASSPLMKSVAEEHWRVPVALSRLREA